MKTTTSLLSRLKVPKKTIVYQVRLDGTTWKQSFKTLEEATEFKSKSIRFKKEGYIVKITTERLS
jgi:hypothetical protein